MRVVIRADASREIGIGHVVRCLTLAECLRQGAAQIAFACDDLPGNMIDGIRHAGFEVRDAALADAVGIDWLVVDHYGLDRGYESSMRLAARKILVIDDLADRPHDCDLLLDQNLYDDIEMRYRKLVPRHALILTGPRFALLRPEFAQARARAGREGPLRRILVFFGGSDPTNETLKTLRALEQLGSTDIAVDVLIGVSNPHREEVTAYAGTLQNVAVLARTDRMSELMLRADLAIGGGGTTSWERCCLGLPSITIAVADNQVELSRTLGDRGYQHYLGRFDQVTVEGIADALAQAIAGFREVAAMGLRGMQLVDGLGVQRVAAAMGRA